MIPILSFINSTIILLIGSQNRQVLILRIVTIIIKLSKLLQYFVGIQFWKIWKLR
jgi:hypothetical protein